MYRKLKRVWSHNDMNYIPGFRNAFPELKNVSSEELCDRWIDLGIDFYTQKQTPINPLIRLTLPLALIIMLIMFISLPIVFIVTGEWGYSLTKKNRVYNWLKSLKLI